MRTGIKSRELSKTRTAKAGIPDPLVPEPELILLIVPALLPQAFDLALPFFLAQAALARSARDGGRPPDLGPDRCQPHQGGQLAHRVLAVAVLGAAGTGLYQQHAVRGDPLAGQTQQTLFDLDGKSRRMPDIEPKLDCGRHLVDVLASGSRATDEGHVNVRLADDYVPGNLDHVTKVV